MRNVDMWDGAMIVLAMYTLNILHPGWFLFPELEKPGSTSLYTTSTRFEMKETENQKV